MLVCESCFQAMKTCGNDVSSAVVIVVDETDPDESKCEKCKENGNNTLYDI